MSHNNNSNVKKNDFPQKPNMQPQTQASDKPPVVLEEGQSESSQFALFNKTSLIGIGVLAIALISVAIPYSLGWFSSSDSVVEAPASELEGQPGDVETDPPLENNSLEYTAGEVDDVFSGFGTNDLSEFDPVPFDSPGFPVDPLVEPQESFERSAFASTTAALLEDEEEYEDELLDIPGLDEDFEVPSLVQSQPERVAAQQPLPTFGAKNRESQNQEPKLATPQRNTAAEDLYSEPATRAQVDQSAIRASSLAEPAVSAVLPKNSLRIPRHDTSPDTTHPIGEDDDLLDDSIVQARYAAESFAEDPDDAELPQNMESPVVLRKEYRPKYAKVTQGARALPNTHGQLWCEYDITPFTKAPGIVPGSLPEQTIVKWVLSLTGKETWHSEPFGLLSATTDTLYVYHTPETQEIVAEVVDRFVNPKGETDGYMFRVVSLNGPNWLTPFHSNLKPIRIDTAGAQGWLIAKEDYAKMISELARRSDYKELSSPQFPVRNGRQHVISASIPKNYSPNVLPKDDVWPGYVSETAVINEGYSMTLIPLSGVDSVSADLMVKCESMQVEKMHTVPLHVSSKVTARQRITVESPQVSHFSLDEQIRWPKDKVLVLSLGTIPVPSATQNSNAISTISQKISGSPATRGHVLLFVECRTQ